MLLTFSTSMSPSFSLVTMATLMDDSDLLPFPPHIHSEWNTAAVSCISKYMYQFECVTTWRKCMKVQNLINCNNNKLLAKTGKNQVILFTTYFFSYMYLYLTEKYIWHTKWTYMHTGITNSNEYLHQHSLTRLAAYAWTDKHDWLTFWHTCTWSESGRSQWWTGNNAFSLPWLPLHVSPHGSRKHSDCNIIWSVNILRAHDFIVSVFVLRQSVRASMS